MNKKLAIFPALAFVSAGQLALAAELDLQPQMEEVVVQGKFVPDEKRDTSEISNVLDEEALDLLADSTVGDALSRVTGLSLVGGKYVYVRGLGERYSSTLINGFRISSPVPFQKTVPLDIVPKGIVRNLLVQKTYSSEYPGDFSGGVVDIRTLATPNDTYLNVNLSVGGNERTTDGTGLTYDGGSWDNWGYDDGTRDIPTNIAALTSEQFEAVDYPDDRALGASFYNRWEIFEKEMKPNVGGDAELGVVHELDNGTLIGFLAAVEYGNDYMNTFEDFRRYEFTGIDGGSNQTVQFDQNTTTQTVNMSGFYSLGMETNNLSLSLAHIILRQTTDEVQQQIGTSSEDDVNTGTEVISYRMQFIENEITSTSLSGQYYFDIGPVEGGVMSFRLVDGGAERTSPDRRTYTYAFDDGVCLDASITCSSGDGLYRVVIPSQQAAGDLREVFQAPDRNFSELEDEIEEYGFDFELPFYFGSTGEATIKLGYSDYQRTRASVDRLFRFDVTTAAPDYVTLMTPYQLFDIPNWANGWVDARDFSASAANASGIFPFASSGEENSGWYIALDSMITPTVRIQLGVRSEDTTLSADAWGGNTDPGTVNASRTEYSDTLPGGSITWEFIPDMQVRVAYSETVNRPSLLEITGTTLRNPQDNQLYRGNVFLEPAELESLDARWEWYFGANDSMSVGVFDKQFTNPIEIGKVQAQNDIFTWFNGEEAELNGVELEFRKDLFFDDWFDWGEAWNGFALNANVSFIDSNVVLFGPGEGPSDVPVTGNRQIDALFQNERPLTGQSDVLGNLILSYVDFNSGIEGSIAYNYTGERTVLVGAENAPNIIEDARGKLDFLLKWNFTLLNTDMTVEFKAQNLLDEEVLWTQGGLLYERYEPGISYSASFKATLF